VTTLSAFRTAALCSALFCGVVRASADDAPEAISLQYLAPANCPSEQAFVSRVEVHTRKVRWVPADEARRHLSITVEVRDARTTGTLTIDGEGERSITARTCEEVVDALALATALAIDPDQLGTEPEPPPDPAPEPERELEPRPSQKTPTVVPRAKGPEPGSLGAGSHLLFSVAPDIVAGVSLDVALRGRWLSVFDSSLRLSFGYLDSGFLERPTALRLTWLPWSRALACPVHLPLAPHLDFSPCIGGQLGRLRAVSGEAIDEPLPASYRQWFAVDAGAELELAFEPFGLYLMGGGLLPLRRLRYLVASPSGRDALVHDLAVKPSVFVGLGARVRLFGAPD
jgi:hypothetical protein